MAVKKKREKKSTGTRTSSQDLLVAILTNDSSALAGFVAAGKLNRQNLSRLAAKHEAVANKVEALAKAFPDLQPGEGGAGRTLPELNDERDYKVAEVKGQLYIRLPVAMYKGVRKGSRVKVRFGATGPVCTV